MYHNKKKNLRRHNRIEVSDFDRKEAAFTLIRKQWYEITDEVQEIMNMMNCPEFVDYATLSMMQRALDDRYEYILDVAIELDGMDCIRWSDIVSRHKRSIYAMIDKFKEETKDNFV